MMSRICLSESELIVALQNDNINAFEQLYLKYRSGIYKNILKLLKDPEESKNVMQDVFVSLWEKRTTLDPSRSVSGWLFTVSYNKSITGLKKTLRESVLHEYISIDSQDYQLNDLKEAKLRLIDEAILSLSPQKQRVFQLCKLEGKTYEEAAVELNISKHTVKEYLAGAVKSIRAYVEMHPVDAVLYVYLIVLLFH